MTADERHDPLAARLRELDGDAWNPVAPPPLAPIRPVRTRRSWTARRLFALPAAAVAAVVIVVAGGGPGVRPAIALEPLPLAPADARASVTLPDRDGGEVRLVVIGARPTPPGFDEELWLLGDEGAPVSLGTYRVGADGRAEVTFRTGADPGDYRFVDVSREPRDGDPGHSARSLLRSERLD